MRFMMIMFPKDYANGKDRLGTRPQKHRGNRQVPRGDGDSRRTGARSTV